MRLRLTSTIVVEGQHTRSTALCYPSTTTRVLLKCTFNITVTRNLTTNTAHPTQGRSRASPLISKSKSVAARRQHQHPRHHLAQSLADTAITDTNTYQRSLNSRQVQRCSTCTALKWTKTATFMPRKRPSSDSCACTCACAHTTAPSSDLTW